MKNHRKSNAAQPITVFTYGDPDEQTAAAIAADIVHAAVQAGGTIIGDTTGRGVWEEDEHEHAGVIIVSGLRSRRQAADIAAPIAYRFDQDAIGVLHEQSGRTLVPGVPASSCERAPICTAAELWQ